MKKLLKRVYMYSTAGIAGGALTMAALHSLRGNRAGRRLFLAKLANLFQEVVPFGATPSAEETKKTTETWLAHGAAQTGQRLVIVPGEARDRLIEHLKKDEPVCMCSRCIVSTMTGVPVENGESHVSAPEPTT